MVGREIRLGGLAWPESARSGYSQERLP